MASFHLRADTRAPISGDSANAKPLSYAAPTAPIFNNRNVGDAVGLHDGLRRAPNPTPPRQASFTWLETWLHSRNFAGAAMLAIGNGQGDIGVELAHRGAAVTDLDVSQGPEIADTLSFEDDSFDVAICANMMPFVDFDRTIAELSRVTRRDGTVVITDALGADRKARNRPPPQGATVQTRHQKKMTFNDIDRLRAHFGWVDVHTFDLLTRPMIMIENRLDQIHPGIRRILAPISAGFRAADRILLKWRPLRRYASRAVIILKWPRVHETG